MTFGLATVQTTVASKTPDKIVLYSVPGWGKTSLAAQFPKPIFLTTKGEKGLQKLIQNGALPPVAHIEDADGNTPETWNDVLGVVNQLITDPHDYKYLVIDTANGLEEMLQAYVCETQFKGDWGEEGFMAYHKGYSQTAIEWSQFLRGPLETLNQDRKVGIILLTHSTVREIKNPVGTDYSQFRPALHEKCINPMFAWADMVLFGGYKVSASKDKSDKTAKAQGGKSRWLYTSYSPAREAKSRVGLEEEIKMGDSPQESFRILCEAIVRARSQNTKEQGNGN